MSRDLVLGMAIGVGVGWLNATLLGIPSWLNITIMGALAMASVVVAHE